jgi:shikimate kinase
MSRVRHVVLVGLPGSGKSSIGRRVAERLDRPFVDGDDELEALTGGRNAGEIQDVQGAGALHDLEEQVALAALERPESSVIGPASSVCESACVRDELVDHTVIWLSAPVDYLAKKAGEKHRPVPEGEDLEAALQEQIGRREASMRSVVDLTVDVTSMSQDDAADAIATFVDDQAPAV